MSSREDGRMTPNQDLDVCASYETDSGSDAYYEDVSESTLLELAERDLLRQMDEPEHVNPAGVYRLAYLQRAQTRKRTAPMAELPSRCMVGSMYDNRQSTSTVSCSCSKGTCLMLYCECFQSCRHCADLCTCSDCKNNQDFAEERHQVILQTIQENPQGFRIVCSPQVCEPITRRVDKRKGSHQKLLKPSASTVKHDLMIQGFAPDDALDGANDSASEPKLIKNIHNEILRVEKFFAVSNGEETGPASNPEQGPSAESLLRDLFTKMNKNMSAAHADVVRQLLQEEKRDQCHRESLDSEDKSREKEETPLDGPEERISGEASVEENEFLVCNEKMPREKEEMPLGGPDERISGEASVEENEFLVCNEKMPINGPEITRKKRLDRLSHMVVQDTVFVKETANYLTNAARKLFEERKTR